MIRRFPGLSRHLVPFLIVAAFFFTTSAEARVVIKMATLAPDGSVWDEILSDMGAEWQEATNGEVSLRIYPGGVAGDEPDLIRKMRIGQLHASALTVGGLSELDPGFEIFTIPMFFDSYEELFHVLEEMRPTLEKRLEAKGYVLVHWMQAGWVHFFSKKPIRVVDDLKKQKLFVWAGDDDLVQLWRRNGFRPVPLAMTDALTGLQTGMIEAMPSTPLAAMSLQWFRQAPYMQGMGLAPLVGGTVISKKIWDRISPEDQAAMKKIALVTEKRLMEEIPVQDKRAVELMTERGLEVVSIDARQEAEWKAAAEEFTVLKREQMEAKDLLDEARRLRDAYRKRQGSGSAE